MKKLPSKYRMDVVDGKLVFSAPSSKVQKPASVAAVETAPSASAKTAVANGCKQCNKPFEQTRPYPPQLYCTATCRKKYQNKKKYEENRPKSAKRDGVSLSATCAQCNELFLYDRKRFGRHKKFCKKECRSTYHKNIYNAKKVRSTKTRPPSPQPVFVKAPSNPVKKGDTKTCEQCKKSFPPRSSWGAPQIYCTVKCRTKYNNDKNYKFKHKETSDNRACLQCSTKLEGFSGRGQPKKYCNAECRKKWFNNKYKRVKEVSALTFCCRLCKKETVKRKGNQVYCSLTCRELYYGNLNKKVLSESVEKLHGVSYTQKPGSTVKRSFVAKVEEALATLPPEEKLPPIPEDTSAASLLAAGRTLTPLGLAEAVQNTYGIDVAEERPRPKAFWFSVLLARHSRTLEDWKKLLGKHGLVSNPKIEKWLLFRAGSSSPAAAGRLKAQLGI